MRPIGGVIAVAWACAACAEAAPEGAEIAVRDSAGVRVVESRVSTGVAPTIRLSEAPVVEIGVVEGAEEYQLDRVTGTTRLADGRIVVASGGREIRYYDGGGVHVRTTGRAGAGPGEYRAISYMRRLEGDSVLVFDGMNRRLSVLSPSGEHARDVALPQDRFAGVAAALADGTLLVRAPRGPGGAMSNSEFVRDTAEFEVVREDERLPVARVYEGSERRVMVNEEGGRITSIQIMSLPFARNVYTAATADRFIIASNYTYDLHVVDGTGSVRTIIRRPDVQPQPVTTELLERLVEAEVARARAAGQTVDEGSSRRLAQSYQRVESVPAYGIVLAAEDGSVWVQEWTPPSVEPLPAWWSVFAADGGLRGRVQVPAGFRPMYADGDVVIGVFRDDLDVEYVRVYEVLAGM